MDKRLELIRQIINSDEVGVSVIWAKLHGETDVQKNAGFTKRDLIKASANAFAKLVKADDDILVMVPIFAQYSKLIETELFKEEK